MFWGFNSRVSQVRVCPRTLGASVMYTQPAEAYDWVDGVARGQTPMSSQQGMPEAPWQPAA